MTMTVLVFFPQVASIAVFLSLAAETIRFAGAESAPTTATILSLLILFPYPTSISFTQSPHFYFPQYTIKYIITLSYKKINTYFSILSQDAPQAIPLRCNNLLQFRGRAALRCPGYRKRRLYQKVLRLQYSHLFLYPIV